MTENRLLSNEKIAEIYFENDTILPHTPKVKAAWLTNIKKYRNETLDFILAEQDKQTRQATLKEVGEWLENELTEHGTIQYNDVAKLLRGEMPE